MIEWTVRDVSKLEAFDFKGTNHLELAVGQIQAPRRELFKIPVGIPPEGILAPFPTPPPLALTPCLFSLLVLQLS